MILCNHHHYLSSSQTETTTTLLSVYMNLFILPILNIVYMESYNTCLLCLAYCT